ncbi:zeta toxin family protein [Streptomyces sp. IBSBF 2806]|uniref:zeta toxin family protein n=1 Tax=Streptomyces sp. IBSBF 2806 TaxID=2903529 RepID=UPI002FDC6289
MTMTASSTATLMVTNRPGLPTDWHSPQGRLDAAASFLSEALTGGGRYVSWENHDTCAQQMLQTLAIIEAEQLADRITVRTARQHRANPR